MKNIVVFIYFYKNKYIENILSVLENSKSKDNNIHYFIYDQNNEDKSKLYKKYKNVTYKHIFWDNRNGVGKYRDEILNKEYDYYLEVKNLNSIVDDWDKNLINSIDNKTVVLGSSFNNFDLMFMNSKNAKVLNNINFIKFYGKELSILYFYYINNINVKHLNDNFYSSVEDTVLSADYVPYSLYDGYNNIIELIKNNLKFSYYLYSNYNLDIKNLKKSYLPEDNFKYPQLIYNFDKNNLDRFNGIPKKMITIESLDNV